MRSPKDKFFAEIVFDKPQIGIGSVANCSANTIEQIEAYIQHMNYDKCNVVIRENKAQYPSFDWVIVKKYQINKV